MKAVRIHEYGGPEVLRYEDAPPPVAGADEVLVRVRAASINPIDVGMREGVMARILPSRLPLTLGQDFAGTIEEAGASVGDLQPGQDVFGATRIETAGAYAEYVVAPRAFVAVKPANVSYEEAAAVPVAGLTARQALFDRAGLRAGQSALIHGAAGGVGHFAVQLARRAGARVIATASRAAAEFVRDLGADEVIDYESGSFEQRARDIDAVLDGVGGETRRRSWQTLKPGGVLVSIVAAPGEVEREAAEHDRRGVGFHMRPDAAQLAEVARLMENGELRAHVARTFTLAEARAAHEAASQSGKRGKLVLRVGQS